MCVPTCKLDNKSLLQDLCSSLPICSPCNGVSCAISPPLPLLERTAINCGWTRPKVPQENVLSHTHVVLYLSQSCTFGCILQLPTTSERKAQYLIPLSKAEIFFKGILLTNCFAFVLVLYPSSKLVNSLPAHTCSQIQVLGSDALGSSRMYTRYSVFFAACGAVQLQ